jgi:hypothetical protein
VIGSAISKSITKTNQLASDHLSIFSTRVS